MPAFLPLWHLAHAADWEAAQAAGEYLISTRGRSLEQEGFIHCCYPHQLGTVARAFYADDPQPLLLLEIDREVLEAHGVMVRVQSVPGTTQQFPHVFGPIPVAAVAEARPVEFDDVGNLLIGDPGAV